MKPSFTLICSGIFFLLIGHSMYSIYELFQKPKCIKNDICYKSYLNTKPDLDLYVYISDNSKSANYQLVLQKNKFDYMNSFEEEVSIEISKTVRNNGSLFIHTIIIPTRLKSRSLDIEELANSPDATYLKSRLTKFAVPVSAAYNLLKDSNKRQSLKPVTHLRSRYVINMCVDELEMPHSYIPAEIVRYIRLNNKKQLLPIVQQDVLQMRLRDLVEITPDTFQKQFTFIYTPNKFGKMRFMAQIEATLYRFFDLGFTEKDIDEVKGVFADTNFYLLSATVFIGSVHLLFDFLSFKSDVSFWKSHSSMAGLSTRTVLWRAFSQTIVFLFLLDEGTSLIVLIPSGIATLIEFWKVSKVLKTSFSITSGFKSNKTETAEEIKTRQYDDECMKYLSYILYPLLIGAAVYSLVYQPHRSWYSWTINSLVNCVYAFGFLFMLPQLFINYRLKSVAALPWRAFTYKAFNTFIDDVFAFIITMPTVHRVACFRDDVVFLIYLYQRWLYPVDKTRTDDIGSEEIVSSDEKKTK